MRPWPLPLRLLNKRTVQLQEMFFRPAVVLGHPFAIALESGNFCNLSCPLCATTFREPRIPRGRLTLEVARAILDRFPALLDLNLSIWGEPLLNPEFFEIIRYARGRGIDVALQSNFALERFDRDMAQRLLDSDLNRLWLSIDGASPEGYARYRRGGRFDIVLRNLEELRSLQLAQGRKHPRITWKMVVHRYNETEVTEARAMAERLGAEFLVVEIYVPEGLEDRWKPSNPSWGSGHRRHRDMGSRCYSLWQFMAVNFNGDVFPCCSEWSPKDALGNVLRDPVASIWNNATYRARRAKNRRSAPQCTTCHTDQDTVFWKQWHEQEVNGEMDPDAGMSAERPEESAPRTAHRGR